MTPGAFAAGLLGALVCLAPRVAHADDEQAAPPDGGQDEWGSIIQRGKAQEQVIESDEERKRRTEAQKRLAAEDPAARARLQAERAAAKRQQEAAFQKRKGLRLLAYGGVGFGSYDAAMRVDEAKDDITFTSDTLSAMAGLGLRAAASPAVDFQLRAMFVVSGEGEGTYNCDGGEYSYARYEDCGTPTTADGEHLPPGRVTDAHVALAMLDGTLRFRAGAGYFGAGAGLTLPLVTGRVIRDAEAKAGLESTAKKANVNAAPTTVRASGILEGGFMVGPHEDFDLGVRGAIGAAPMVQVLFGWAFY